MKAAIIRRYGSPEVVGIAEIPKPVPKENEVLVRVCAASVNPLDWHGTQGSPYIARMAGGVRAPKDPRLGIDVAGRVETVGRNVTGFRPEDRVFGMCKGAFAEYACASAAGSAMSVLARMHENLTFEQAAAAPVAALTALQAIRDKGKIQPGQKVLIHGASGGVGTFAVQFANYFGAEVTGVCSTRNIELVRSLGAARVIDYTKEDWAAASSERYDLLIDCVGDRSLVACARILQPKGTHIVITGPNGPWLGPLARMLKALTLSPFVSRHLVPFIAKASRDDLTFIGKLIAAGAVTPVIDRRYRFSEVRDAIRHVEEGHARGKVVITME